MPLETATYIADLNSTNPAATDAMAQGDDHIRLLKGVLKAQFPNFTSAASVATNAAIDAAAAAATNGATILADAGAFFKTNTTDGVTNPVAGEVDIKAGGLVALKVKSDLSVTAVGAYLGGTGQLLATGETTIWWTDTLPIGRLWCNGAAVSRTTYAALFAVLGTTYGIGDGATTFNLPDLRDNVPVGKGTMGAVSAAGRLTNWVTTALGAFIGACTHVLTAGQLASHTHTTAPHIHGYQRASAGAFAAGTGGPISLDYTDNLTATDPTTVTVNATGSDQAHNNVQTGTICNWIIKT